MPKFIKLPEYGITIVEGAPGSGKSALAVRWLCGWMLTDRRPVWTNLPLRWRVVRKYLERKGGREIASLVHPLTHEHFEAYIKRATSLRNYLEAARQSADRDGAICPSARVLESRFDAEHGPPIRDGAGANWIDHGAVICIDEMQNWYPMRSQSTEHPALQEYLSVHRHFLHNVVVITQHRSRVSITIRRLALRVWIVTNRANHRILWNVKFSHFRIHPIGYQLWDIATEELPPFHDQRRPVLDFTWYPQLPSQQVFFRLYNSFTAIASPRRIVDHIAAARQRAGLRADGRTHAEERRDSMLEKKRAGIRARLFRATLRALRRAFGVLLFLTLGYLLGRLSAPSDSTRAPGRAAHGNQETASGPASIPDVVLSAVTNEYAFAGGRRYAIDEQVWPGVALGAIVPSEMAVLYSVADGVPREYWVWMVGKVPQPRARPTSDPSAPDEARASHPSPEAGSVIGRLVNPKLRPDR